MSIIEQLVYSTVRIQSEKGFGSGFIYCFKQNDSYYPTIITNKHVVENSKHIILRFSLSDDNNKIIDGNIQGFRVTGDFYISHPDSSVDLVAIPIGYVLNNPFSIKLYFRFLDEKIIPSNEYLASLYTMEDIIMIGYPIGLWDSKNNIPIIRKGITATHPKLGFDGRDEFVIDMACFPGSSGSPVFLLNEGSYTTNSGLVVGSRVKLLGILYGGPQYSVDGQLKIINVPTIQMPVTSTSIPVNLGFVIKSNRIVDFNDTIASFKPNFYIDLVN